MNFGRLGEDVAAGFYRKAGFKILLRNFRVKSGELDLICQKGNFIVFVEVKALVSSEGFFPEMHFTKEKVKRLKKAIEIFLIENSEKEKLTQQLDLLTVDFSPEGKVLEIRRYENVSGGF